MSIDAFDVAKRKLLNDIDTGVDFSPKGSIDIRIRELVAFLNQTECFATTSSCSGRIAVFRNISPGAKGIEWLRVKHTTVTKEEVQSACRAQIAPGEKQDNVLTVLKCEGFILHVLCKDLPSACSLHGKHSMSIFTYTVPMEIVCDYVLGR